MTAMPIEIPISYQEIAHCLDKSISKIENGYTFCIGTNSTGIICRHSTKGYIPDRWWALLRGLDRRLTDKINIPFLVAEDPLQAVVRGTGIA